MGEIISECPLRYCQARGSNIVQPGEPGHRGILGGRASEKTRKKGGFTAAESILEGRLHPPTQEGPARGQPLVCNHYLRHPTT